MKNFAVRLIVAVVAAICILSSSAFAQNPRDLPEETTPDNADIFVIWPDSPEGTRQISVGTLRTEFLAGISGGKTITGGTGSGEHLKLVSTSHATKGEIQINLNSATLPAHTVSGTVFHIGGADSTATRMLFDGFTANGIIDFRSSDGTAASPTALATTRNIGQIGWFGRGSTTYSAGSRAAIRAITTEAWTDSAQGAYLSFFVTPIGSTTSVEGLKIESDKLVALGYIRETATCTPASATATCTTGDHCWDSNFEYRCVATNTWKRAALSTW